MKDTHCNSLCEHKGWSEKEALRCSLVCIFGILQSYKLVISIKLLLNVKRKKEIHSESEGS